MTAIRFTTPISSGWITFTFPAGINCPFATAMMSTLLIQAQLTATITSKMMTPIIERPAGEAGVSMISSAPGRNSDAASRLRGDERRGKAISLPVLRTTTAAVSAIGNSGL